MAHYIESLQNRYFAKMNNSLRIMGAQKNHIEEGVLLEGPPSQSDVHDATAHFRSPVFFEPKLNEYYRSVTLYIPAKDHVKI